MRPKKEIDDESDDQGHNDEEAPLQVEISHASPEDHQFLVGQVVKQEEGVTHQVFQSNEPAEGEDAPPQEGEGEGDAEKSDEPEMPKNVYVKEVVREPKMKFFRVPQLGSFQSVLVRYNACLDPDSLDDAIADKLECEKKREDQENEKREW